MKTILIALDREKESEKLIGLGLSLATKFQSKIWLVHIAAPDPEFVGYEVGPQYIRDFRAKELKQEHQYLRGLAERLHEKGVEAQGLLIEGPTADRIIEESERLEADLIMLGSHKHSVIHHIFVGDTAETVLKRSSIPLLVVPILEDRD